MTLAKEVQNHSGRKLLSEGALLTDKHILSFKAWGIAEAAVQAKDMELDSVGEEVNIDLKELAQAEKEVGALFSFSNQDHPAVVELMRLSSLNRLKKKPGMGHVNVR